MTKPSLTSLLQPLLNGIYRLDPTIEASKLDFYLATLVYDQDRGGNCWAAMQAEQPFFIDHPSWAKVECFNLADLIGWIISNGREDGVKLAHHQQYGSRNDIKLPGARLRTMFDTYKIWDKSRPGTGDRRKFNWVKEEFGPVIYDIVREAWSIEPSGTAWKCQHLCKLTRAILAAEEGIEPFTYSHILFDLPLARLMRQAIKDLNNPSN